LVNEEATGNPQDTPASYDTAIELLNKQLGEPVLKSSTRILILILLSVHKRMRLVELGRFTGLGRSSLGNHLQILEAAGYVEIKVANTFAGRRQMIEITKKGLEDCRELLDMIRCVHF
jgi:DNA-binding MarR family transcriptional regulator